MSLRNRLLAPLSAALVGSLVGSLLLLAPAPAQAATKGDVAGHSRGPDAVFKRSSYLCYGYADCREKGMGNAGYAQANDKMYWRMYSGHNCTNYAAYRMVKSGMPNERPWSGSGNAMYWGTSMPRITDDVPRVGAVTWWRANAGPAGSVGHVGYVEKVVSKDEIIVSQDSWGGDFSWAVITRSSGNWPSGFIHFNDKALTNEAAPEIDGIAKVGSVLTATRGAWSPNDVAVDYQWLADGDAIRGATAATLRLTRKRLDQVITVAATASKPGFPERTVRSQATDAVLPGTLKNLDAPMISGDVQVDHTISLDTGSWSPTPDGLAVAWFADGQPVEGADGGTTLALTPELVGTRISATVTATRAGYEPVTVNAAPTEPVAPGTFTVSTLPTIHGNVTFGETLTVDPGVFSPGDATVAVQWLRNGAPIAAATTSSYQIQNVDLGSRISVRVTLTRSGYLTQAADSASTVPVKSDPFVRVKVLRLHHRVRLMVAVRAPGVDVPSGPVSVRLAGVERETTLRNGVARLVLRGLDPGPHRLTVRYGGSDSVHAQVLTRDVHVRR